MSLAPIWSGGRDDDEYAAANISIADVRFAPESGQRTDVSVCPLCAKSGLVRCSKRRARVAMIYCGFEIDHRLVHRRKKALVNQAPSTHDPNRTLACDHLADSDQVTHATFASNARTVRLSCDHFRFSVTCSHTCQLLS